MTIQAPAPRIERQHSQYQTDRPATPSSYGLRVYRRIIEGDDVQAVFNSAPEGTARVPTVIEVAPGLYEGSFYLPKSFTEIVAPLGQAIFLRDTNSTNWAEDKLGASLGLDTDDMGALNVACSGLDDASGADTIQEQWIVGITVVNLRKGGTTTGKLPEAALNIGHKNDDQAWNNIRIIGCETDGNRDSIVIFDGGAGRTAFELMGNFIKSLHHCLNMVSCENMRGFSSGNIIRSDPNRAHLLSRFQDRDQANPMIGVRFGAGMDCPAGTFFLSAGDLIEGRSSTGQATTSDNVGIQAAGDDIPEKVDFQGTIIRLSHDDDEATLSDMVGLDFASDVLVADGQFVFDGMIDINQPDDDIVIDCYGVRAGSSAACVPRVLGHVNVVNADIDRAVKSLRADGATNEIKHAVYSDQDAEEANSGTITALTLAATP